MSFETAYPLSQTFGANLALSRTGDRPGNFEILRHFLELRHTRWTTTTSILPSLLGPECADAQSHTSGARLPKNLDESEQRKNLDESEEPTDLTQPQQREKQHHSDSYF